MNMQCHLSVYLYPESKDRVEAGSLADAEASVTVQQTGRGAICHKVFLHGHKHWDLGAIFGWIEYLIIIMQSQHAHAEVLCKYLFYFELGAIKSRQLSFDVNFGLRV